jgi:argininosuccinate synthase
MFTRSVAPENAPDKPECIEVEFKRGDAIAINGEKLSPAMLLTKLNELGGKHGIGRLDLVENRYVGMKSRGVYETPGGTILLAAHRGIESITLDRGAAHLKDEIMPRYAELIYNGYWWSPERQTLQVLIDHTQQSVNGRVVLKLFKGNVIVTSRSSDYSLFDTKIATFDDDGGAYNQADAGGFIKLNALRMRIAGVKAAARKAAKTPAKKAPAKQTAVKKAAAKRAG